MTSWNRQFQQLLEIVTWALRHLYMFKTTLQQSRMEELFVEIVIANQQS